MASVRQKAVRFAFSKRRIGEQRGTERLEREADPEFLHHVGLTRIIEVGLDGARAQHHIKPHAADPRHMAEHDRITALGHDRQFITRLVRPHPKPKEPQPKFATNFLDLPEMPSGLGAGLVQIFKRCARKFKLPGRLKADIAVRPAKRDDMAALNYRFPAKAGQSGKQIANATGFIV